ncbi:related to RGP1 Reduced growth phenotype protein [Rhynchosporium secalis]|uniref:Related to RGP1 Reduced growth phenotype protein n=1 Tax=Rhynchosporium secalis TaxID=38038 RepID=A0A1E1M8X5_RHYSE|nr:related to RGP1 Reduced growth phenotype protein [Rhynchosporium secalis]
MSAPVSNIRVFVNWAQQTVFAGEDIECQITFKNISNTPTPPRTSLHPSSANGSTSTDRLRKTALAHSKDSTSFVSPAPPINDGHRTSLSLNVSPLLSGTQHPAGPFNGPSSKISKDASSHKRSVSIISIGASEGGGGDLTSQGSLSERPGGSSRGHGRSASLQTVPRRYAVNGPSTAAITQRSATQPSPLSSLFSPIETDSGRPMRRPGITTAPSTPSLPGRPFPRRKGSGSPPQTFKFPATLPPTSDHRNTDHLASPLHQDNPRLLSPRSRENVPAIAERVVSATRVLSPASVAGTARSSGEFYSLSNNSTETLASEYLPQQQGRVPLHGAHARQPSNLSPASQSRPPETLMMGYAQIHGSFTLDASLISQAPFEEVKRRGAVGGQGGGVIGLETNKRDSGLLRGFGWGNIGESLGGLLGGGELSSIKDMRGIASSRSIPLLSTPQSILFIDLRLAPGESRSYSYAFKLPRGLPPSHRGKVIKISYKLVIGTQRPGGAKEQQVKSVEVPFRILGSVNNHGELLGHDLMSPYIILRDQAQVHAIEVAAEAILENSKGVEVKESTKTPESTLDGFLTYVDELLAAPRHNSSAGLLSPTELPKSRRQSFLPEPATAKEAIDMAILRSNVATDPRQSANRFEIARSGKRVAVVMLARPAYRLGETISAAIDFTDAEIPCYAIHASLETSEKVDNSISLRSEASILRVTRKTHASHSESTLYSRRVFFSPTIPASATPEFITSGVSLEWRVRIEFVTPRLLRERNADIGYVDILEEVSRDDRCVVLAAAEALDCESFEIVVPLRIYGALATSTERNESSNTGLVV